MTGKLVNAKCFYLISKMYVGLRNFVFVLL